MAVLAALGPARLVAEAAAGPASGPGRGRARPDPPLRRMAAWARRQPARTWLAVAAVTIAIGLPAGTLIFWQAQPSLQWVGSFSWWSQADGARAVTTEAAGATQYTVPLRPGKIQGFAIFVYNPSDLTEFITGSADHISPGAPVPAEIGVSTTGTVRQSGNRTRSATGPAAPSRRTPTGGSVCYGGPLTATWRPPGAGRGPATCSCASASAGSPGPRTSRWPLRSPSHRARPPSKRTGHTAGTGHREADQQPPGSTRRRNRAQTTSIPAAVPLGLRTPERQLSGGASAPILSSAKPPSAATTKSTGNHRSSRTCAEHSRIADSALLALVSFAQAGPRRMAIPYGCGQRGRACRPVPNEQCGCFRQRVAVSLVLGRNSTSPMMSP